MKSIKRSARYIPVGSTMQLGEKTYMLVCVSRSPLLGLEFHFEDIRSNVFKKVFYRDELQDLINRGIEFNIISDEYGELQEIVKKLSKLDDSTNISKLVSDSCNVLSELE